MPWNLGVIPILSKLWLRNFQWLAQVSLAKKVVAWGFYPSPVIKHTLLNVPHGLRRCGRSGRHLISWAHNTICCICRILIARWLGAWEGACVVWRASGRSSGLSAVSFSTKQRTHTFKIEVKVTEIFLGSLHSSIFILGFLNFTLLYFFALDSFLLSLCTCMWGCS